ncbi:MAG: primosomal replication protein N [Neisseria sp.]|nr:primosomal replication protein N [Neisseria sp.]
MSNRFTLAATIVKSSPLRYTPAGIPVLEVLLRHESWQTENGRPCLVKFELPAKIIGENALHWQHRENVKAEIEGFLAQRSLKSDKPVLRIQNIQEYKG